MKKFAIHCETEDLAKQVLQIAHEVGAKWADGRDLIEKTSWVDRDTCYNLNVEGMPARVLKSSKSWYICEGFTIVKAKDFIEANERRKAESLKCTDLTKK